MKNIKLFEEFGLSIGNDGKMVETDFKTDEKEDIGPGDIVHFKKYGTLYIVTLTADGYVVSEDENQRYMGDNGEGFIIPFSAALRSQILEKGDDDAYLTESKIKDVNSLIVGKQYKITWPNYDDYDEGIEPETDIIEVISKNRTDGYVLKNIEHDFTFSKQPSMLDNCDIELLESVSNHKFKVGDKVTFKNKGKTIGAEITKVVGLNAEIKSLGLANKNGMFGKTSVPLRLLTKESISNEIEVKFVGKRNQTQAFNVYKTPDGKITRIEKPNHVHINFPFKIGQVMNRSVETWACNNNFYINGKDMCPEEKVFGIRKSDIPKGHELRHLFPQKFR